MRSQHIGISSCARALLIDASFKYLAVKHLAAASSAAPGHARIRHGHLRLAQRVKQVSTCFHADHAIDRLNENFHGCNEAIGDCNGAHFPGCGPISQ